MFIAGHKENAEDISRKYPVYRGDDLGVCYNKEKTSFRLWAPAADKVKLMIFADESRSHKQVYPMSKGKRGTWYQELRGDAAGKYYLYQIEYDHYKYETLDPYVTAVGTNSNLGLIVDLEKTNPEGWEKDRRVKLQNPVDAVIYEVHVRDFSIADSSGIKNKGKYLAFTEEGTVNAEGFRTGIDHLKELGITHVHLLPVFDFASVDDKDEGDYNWGYDPYYYNTPEGSYASNPGDESRIKEFKQMVNNLHEHGLGVIMDVVYNHTYYTEKSAFQITAPYYFYRTHVQCKLANGSGCGNEIATEKPMVRKFIKDSVNYWAQEYHIDGFRFDLMALIDRETMRQIEKSLHKIDPSILLYGEPWAALPPQISHEQQMKKGAQKGMNIAVFNDEFRNGIKGDNDGGNKGFVSGNSSCENAIKRGVVGGIYYNNRICSFAAAPSESINYVSSHDNLTLWDKLLKTHRFTDEKTVIKRDRLAQAIIFTSQGIPFIHGGEEFLRTKYGSANSYNAGDNVNRLQWDRKSRYYDTFRYYRGLIMLRQSHPAFRMRTAAHIRKNLEFIEEPADTVGFQLQDYANGDSWQTICVFYNPKRDWAHFELPEKREWGIVVDDKKAGIVPFNIFKADNVYVPPISAMVLCSVRRG